MSRRVESPPRAPPSRRRANAAPQGEDVTPCSTNFSGFDANTAVWKDMFRNATGVPPLIMRILKPSRGWCAMGLFLACTLASSGVTAAIGEQICTHGQYPEKGDTVACYSDAGCSFAASTGAESIRDYALDSAPFALARGKIERLSHRLPP